MSYFYISNPYNGTEEQKEHRAQVAARVCALLLKRGVFAWSPIVHNHAMMKVFSDFTLDERRAMMLPYDFSLLRQSKGMIVLTIEGWRESFGVKAELELCQELAIPVQYLNPKDLDSEIDVTTSDEGKVLKSTGERTSLSASGGLESLLTSVPSPTI